MEIDIDRLNLASVKNKHQLRTPNPELRYHGFCCCLSKRSNKESSKVIIKTISALLSPYKSYSPGWMKTDMGGEDAPYTVEEGAQTAVYLATLPDGGSQGGFFAEMRKFVGAVSLPW